MAGGDNETPNPFGDRPRPWYKGPPAQAPRGQRYFVGLISGLAAALAAHGAAANGKVVGVLVFVIVAAVPPWALESWWRARRRAREDALLPDLSGRARG